MRQRKVYVSHASGETWVKITQANGREKEYNPGLQSSNRLEMLLTHRQPKHVNFSRWHMSATWTFGEVPL